VQHVHQELLAVTQAAAIGMDGYGRDVRVVQDHPDAAVGN